jgi:SAM-dependent methyltransferase
MSNIIDKVNSYYSEKIAAHGATPKGVDWNGEESQFLRFQILSEVMRGVEYFSILDYGCGFGSLYQFLEKTDRKFDFFGFDVSQNMIDAAQASFADRKNAEWSIALPEKKFDFTVASGIFNVRLDTPHAEWMEYILETLNTFDKISTKGFSFNVLTKYSDAEYMKDYLYYADPLVLFDYCKKHFSRNVALLHDYELYEFTIVVRKN